MLDFSTPRETVLVTTRGNKDHFGKSKALDNIVATDWHMPVTPIHFAISLPKSSVSSSLIMESKIFVVNFVAPAFAEKVIAVGSASGHTTDKFASFGILKDEAEGVDCCRLKEAVAYISCEVQQQIERQEHYVFVGKVVASRELVPGSKRLFHLKADKFTTTKD